MQKFCLLTNEKIEIWNFDKNSMTVEKMAEKDLKSSPSALKWSQSGLSVNFISYE